MTIPEQVQNDYKRWHSSSYLFAGSGRIKNYIVFGKKEIPYVQITNRICEIFQLKILLHEIIIGLGFFIFLAFFTELFCPIGYACF